MATANETSGKPMIDLHSHTLFSDGELGIDELVRRAEVAGYRGLVVSDHVDGSLIDLVLPRLVKEATHLTELTGIWVVPGCELTHCRLEDIADLVKEARSLGAKLVTVHGETRGELKKLFDEVSNDKNWKMPIECKVDRNLVGKYLRAIEFFVGGPTYGIDAEDGSMILTNGGYYQNIGA